MQPRTTLKTSLALAVIQGIASLTVTVPLVLASAWVQAAEHVDFNIAAGSLAGALNQFGQASQILLSYPAALTDGKTSPGLQGRHDLDTGLAILLMVAIPLDLRAALAERPGARGARQILVGAAILLIGMALGSAAEFWLFSDQPYQGPGSEGRLAAWMTFLICGIAFITV